MNIGKYSMDLTCFSWVQIIKKSDLPSTAKLIAMYLSTFMNLEHNIAWPSISRISHETGLGRSTVFKWLNHLEEQEWLIRRSKAHEVMTLGGVQMNNEYIINIPPKVVHEINQLAKGGLQDEQRGSTKSPKVVHQPDTNNNINNNSNNNRGARFQKPTLQELSGYILANNHSIDASQFLDYYESNGWKVGRTPMKDWKAAVRTWARRETKKPMSAPDKVKAAYAEKRKEKIIDIN